MAVAFQQSAFQESAFQEGQVTVAVTGVEAVGSIGTVTILLSSIIIVTGVQATGSIGIVVVSRHAGSSGGSRRQVLANLWYRARCWLQAGSAQTRVGSH